MFCCALAAFILCNLALALRSVRTFIFGESNEPSPENIAVKWNLVDTGASARICDQAVDSPGRRTHRRRLLPIIAILLLTTLAFGVGFFAPLANGTERLAWQYALVAHRNLCSVAARLLPHS